MSNFDCEIHQEDRDEIYECLSCYDLVVATKERERIIQVLEDELADELYKAIVIGLIKKSGKTK